MSGGVIYRPVVGKPLAAEGGGETGPPAAKDERSDYQKAREHFRRFFAGKSAEELRGYRLRLDAARAATGRRPGQKSWLANQSGVYFWALGQEIELEAARQKAREHG